ncbi:MAG: hypothetical protein V3T88_06225, partial [Nitrosomonadaceae bacterium]
MVNFLETLGSSFATARSPIQLLGNLLAGGSQEDLARGRQQQSLQDIGRVLGGADIPEFLLEEQGPAGVRQGITRQLFGLGTPEAAQIALERGQLPSATTNIGKLLQARDRLPEGSQDRALVESAIAKATAPAGPLVQMAPGETAFEKERGKAASKTLDQIQESAGQADQILFSTGIITQALQEGARTGPLAGGAAFLVELGQQAGVDIDPTILAETASLRDIQRESNKLTSQVIATAKGNLSNKELDFYTSQTAGIGKSPEANRRAAAANNAVAIRMKQVEEVATNLTEQGRGREINKELARFRRENPLRDIFKVELEKIQLPTEVPALDTFTAPARGIPTRGAPRRIRIDAQG